MRVGKGLYFFSCLLLLRAGRGAPSAGGGRRRRPQRRERDPWAGTEHARSATDPGAPGGGGARRSARGAPRGPFNIAPVLCELRALIRAQLRSARIMPRYVEGTAPTSPRRGAWGAIGAARCWRGTSTRAEQSAGFDCKRRDGGRGAPARRLRSRRCAARGHRLNTQHERCSRSVQRTSARQEAERCQAQAQPLNEVGQGLAVRARRARCALFLQRA
jgi:hypothetical protein